MKESNFTKILPLSVLCSLLTQKWSSVVLDNAPLLDVFAGVILDDILAAIDVSLLFAPVIVSGDVVILKNGAFVLTVLVVMYVNIVDGALGVVNVGLYVAHVVVDGYVLPVKKDAVVWTVVVVVVFAGVVEDDFLGVKVIGLFVAAVVVSGGCAVVCTVCDVVYAGVVKDVLVCINNMPEVDDILHVDDVLDVLVVGPVDDPIVVDDVTGHVSHVAVDVDTRPFCVLKVVSVGGNDIGGFNWEVMVLCSISKHDTFTPSFIVKGVDIKKNRLRYQNSI